RARASDFCARPALRHAEVAGRGRRYGRLSRLLDLRNPVVRQAVGAIDGVRLPRPGELGKDVLPDDVAFGRDLEDPAVGPLGDQRIAVRQALRAADVRREERARGVRPDEVERDGVDLEHARRRARVDPYTVRRARAPTSVTAPAAAVATHNTCS